MEKLFIQWGWRDYSMGPGMMWGQGIGWIFMIIFWGLIIVGLIFRIFSKLVAIWRRSINDYEIIVDGSDNFPTRYLVNDTCILTKKTLVFGAFFRYEGQAMVIKPGEGPCLRCLFPNPPPPGLVPSCQEAGVLGALAGIIGLIQAAEVLKIILNIGEPLIGKLLIFDSLKMDLIKLNTKRNKDCPLCGENPTIKELIDYEEFCNLR